MTQTPKIEKKEIDLYQNQYGRMSNRPMQCDDEIHVKVVNAEYVSALETALKAAKEYNNWLIDYSGDQPNVEQRVEGRRLMKAYHDALAKVDLK